MSNNGFRNIIGHAGTPVQQSMTMDGSLYDGRSMNTVMMGIVLSVFHSDDPNNESAIRTSSQHGFLHQCSVLVINDGYGSNMLLNKVYILPDQISGVDDYYEQLPKGCTRSLTGQPFNSNLLGLDPAQLDGERCLISFIGGNIDQPFILKWFPHPQNVFDTQTTGQGFPDSEGVPAALDQSGRKFVRINGVEYVVTNVGDIFLNTNFTNSTISPQKISTSGRYGREVNSQTGGSIKINVKPSQFMVLDFNEYQDGVGIGGYNDQLPQTNPRPGGFGSLVSFENTHVDISKDYFKLSSPTEVSVYSGENSYIVSGQDTALTAGNDLTIDVTGDYDTTVQGSKTSTTTGVATIQSGGDLNLKAGFSGSTSSIMGRSTGATVFQCGGGDSTAGDPVNGSFNVSTGGNTSFLVGATGGGDADFLVNSNHDVDIHAENDISITAAGHATIDIDHMLNLNGDEINVGSTTSLPSTNSILLTAFSSDSSFATAFTALNSLGPVITPAQAIAAIPVLQAAIQTLVAALQATATTVTRAK